MDANYPLSIKIKTRRKSEGEKDEATGRKEIAKKRNTAAIVP
ncbi:MAG: hypothetical protein V1867_04475 [Candidatus Falkowbacteria bacterium]